MADISKIILPNGNEYNFKDSAAARLNRGVEFIRGTWSTATSAWTGVTADSSLYDGKKIMLYLPYGGSGNVTLNLTLSTGSTTGAKNVYFQSTTRMSTQCNQYSQIELIYHDSLNINGTTYQGWWNISNKGTYIVASTTQPVGQTAGDIWLVLGEAPTLQSAEGVSF